MRVVVCLPGNNFSSRFLQRWNLLVDYFWRNQINFVVTYAVTCNIYYARQLCLQADVLRGKDQKPFQGKEWEDYDYILWIDSDMVFMPHHFVTLLEMEKDIVSGLYKMQGGEFYTCGKLEDDEYFLRHGHVNHHTLSSLPTDGKPFKVDYVGMGFMLVKKGVYESMEYPWHRPEWRYLEGGVQDFSMEDVGFCINARKAGYDIWVNPSVLVGHEKTMVYI